MKTGVTCVGCKKDSSELEEYDEKENPVSEDGTYHDGKFVCTTCYVELIPLGLDVGHPHVIQYNMKEIRDRKQK